MPMYTSRDVSADDLWLFGEGRHADIHRWFGAHPVHGGGFRFAVWAPDADRVEVVGDFNGWRPGADTLHSLGGSGVWSGVIAEAHEGNAYKYRLRSRESREWCEKADPIGFWHEEAPKTASRIFSSRWKWRDGAWMRGRGQRNSVDAPISIYEVHLGSWRFVGSEQPLYRAIAEPLAEYAVANGFTHVELLPVMEHPFYGSWGYQVTGYFAPTSRYGDPDDLRFLIETLHRRGIGVLLDWVPAHFPSDEHSLARFDGSYLYEHADPRRGWHPDWETCIFNYGRNEVVSFLISSAMYWLDEFHIDGLRVDAVASMLYLDYSREEGEWVPNAFGGNENLEATEFVRRLNETVYARHPDITMIAEESTAWAGVSRPTDAGGLGFGFKWDMGWMHDTLSYMRRDPVHRRFHYGVLTFRGMYAFSENFVLALSHDEVVHGKGSLAGKMPGDDWQRHANVRLLFGYQFAQPGKKLLFQGMEIGQWSEWDHETPIDWSLLDHPNHDGLRRWVADLNALYRREPSLHRDDCRPEGVVWSGLDDDDTSVVTLIRRTRGARPIVAISNFTPVPRPDYRVGLPHGGRWRQVLNGDDLRYGGSGIVDFRRPMADTEHAQGCPYSVEVELPPLTTVFLAPWGNQEAGAE